MNIRIFLILILPVLFLLPARSYCADKPVPKFKKAHSHPFYYEFKGSTDPEVWEKSFSTFNENMCAFLPEETVDGPDSISLFTRRIPDQVLGKDYSGGQLWSRRFFSYGKFTVRMRAPIVSGTVCSFFLMNAITDGNWLHKEIDIEFLGKDRHAVQFNVHRYYVQTETAYGNPYLYESDFDYGEEFHTYTIFWKKRSVEWYVDGIMAHQTIKNVPDEPMQMLMNIWIADPSFGKGWLGPLSEAALPCRAEYQWVKYEPF